MRKATALCIALLFCFSFVACGENAHPATSVRVSNEINSKTFGDKGVDGTRESDVIVRSDAENLVEVRIEKGEVSVTLNAARFDELYDYSNRYNAEIYTGVLKIAGTSGKVKDACIAQISELDFMNGTDFVTPTIFLLMEDGSVEWVAVSYYPRGEQLQLNSFGALMWIEDITALTYEVESEGFGDMTVFAEDSHGTRYDLRIPASFNDLCYGSWVCDIYNTEGYYISGYYGVLTLSRDGTAVYEKGWMSEGAPLRYTGTYELSVADNVGKRPGILTLDMRLDSATNAAGEPTAIRGSYFAEIQEMIVLHLYHADGDYLHTDETAYLEQAEFQMGYNPFDPQSSEMALMIDDYVDYLLSTLESAREMVEVYGMAALDTGEYVEVDGGYYRSVFLGTNHQNQFVREIHYAISDDGVILEYDPVLDEWIVQWVPD